MQHSKITLILIKKRLHLTVGGKDYCIVLTIMWNWPEGEFRILSR